jgi:TetR/AcrR family tetracycline transcriptional repressor
MREVAVARNRGQDVIDAALALLDSGGLAGLSMRRLAADLDVQPSALYHHVPNKQTLLGRVADEMLATVAWPASGTWPERVAATCTELRRALLSHRDGAELVATAWAFRLGGQAAYDALLESLTQCGELAPAAAGTLLHFIYGHALGEQTHHQAVVAGADVGEGGVDDFSIGLGMVIAGIQVMAARPSRG